ncbi:hypothetical protein F53441_3610 [Fusarium austroafricanum]|uniref:Uncharacterized protein n=1 Tax=Fusarium austroafricanum TaxID=2364996 RepID=A0A8H4KQC3_9HYPO|nr:hypothetical protein F53441_3610 [Fusarium austroafricanum]
MHSSFILVAALSLGACAAPVLPIIPTLPRLVYGRADKGINVGKDLGPAGKLVTGAIHKLPVDVKVDAPVIPEKREAAPAVEVDLGGGGLSVKREAAPAVEVDLGGGGLSV